MSTSVVRRLSASVVAALALAVLQPPVAPQEGLLWEVGDLFVGAGFRADWHPTGVPSNPGEYLLLDSSGQQKGVAVVDPIDPPQFTTGCLVNPLTGNLWITSYHGNTITEFAGDPTHDVLETLDLGGLNGLPADAPAVESVAFDAAGNLWAGSTDDFWNPDVDDPLSRFSPIPQPIGDPQYSTGAVTSFTPLATAALTPFTAGINRVDISSDGTIYYTSQDRLIRTFDPASGSATFATITDFAGADLFAYGLRLLPPGDGSGGLLVSTNLSVYRLDGTGAVVQSYAPLGALNFFTISLTPDAQYFWTATVGWPELERPRLYKIHIPTGEIVVGPIELDVDSVFGLCVNLEYLAAFNQCFDETGQPVPCRTPEMCSVGGPDDDGDGLDDAGDPDCAVPNQFEDCATNADDDHDGLLNEVCDRTNAEGDEPGINADAVTFAHETADPAWVYSAIDLPAGLTMQPDGQVIGVVAYDAERTYPTTVSVDRLVDGVIVRSSGTFTWHVTDVDVNDKPAFDAVPADVVAAEGDVVISLMLAATDPDCAAAGYDCELLVSAVSLPPFLTLVPTGDTTAEIQGGTYDFDLGSDSSVDYPIVIRVADAAGLSSDATFTWTVLNTNRPPTLDNPGTQTSQEGQNGDELSFTFFDPDCSDGSPEDCPSPIFALTGTLPSGLQWDLGTQRIYPWTTHPFDSAGEYPLTVAVDDGFGGIDSVDFVWIVENVNRPPTIGVPGDQANTEGDAVALAISADDLDCDDGGSDCSPLLFTAVGLPADLTIDPGTGDITGTVGPTAADTQPPGGYDVTVTVDDQMGGTAEATFNWTVTGANAAPLFDVTPDDRQGHEGDPINPLALSATDPNCADVGQDCELTFSVVSLPAFLTLVPTGDTTAEIRGASPTYPFDVGGGSQVAYDVVIRVSDSSDAGADVALTWTAVNTNRPTTLLEPIDQSSTEGFNGHEYLFDASDPDCVEPGGDDCGPLIFTLSGDLPVGLGWESNATTGRIVPFFVHPFDAAGDYPLSVTVDDGFGGEMTVDFVWTVVNNNRPPLIVDPTAQFSMEGEVVNLSLTATDEDCADGPGDDCFPLTFSLDAGSLPDGLSLDPDTGDITGTVSFTAFENQPASGYGPTISVSDTTDENAITFFWTVGNVNAPPVLTHPGDQASAEGDTLALQIVVTDPDCVDLGSDCDPFTFTATGLPGDLAIDASTGIITGAIALTAFQNQPPGGYQVTVTVDDGNGGSDSESWIWSILDDSNQPPVCTTASALPSTLWPPNHFFWPVLVSGVTDADGTPVQIRIDSIYQDEPVDAPGGGDGHTTPDGMGVGTPIALIRAERTGGSNGRVYHIGFTATDALGATCSGEVTVSVPHNHGRPAIDDGALHDSTTGVVGAGTTGKNAKGDNGRNGKDD